MTNHSEQLAAIMFTDIVGFTSLMGTNQHKAMQLVDENFSIQKPIVEKYKGTWHKEMGDGSLVSFSSAIQAVNCALEIQQETSRKEGLRLRIGIHLGDVTFRGHDVYGDGVNVASRIESITDPGGIYISESVQKAIRGRSEVETTPLGEFFLKNIEYPVAVFALQGNDLPKPSKKSTPDQSQSFIEKLSERNVFRAAFAYIISALILYRGISYFFQDFSTELLLVILVAGFILAMYLAYTFEFSPKGIVRTASKQAYVNPYSASKKKPLTGSTIVGVLSVVAIVTFIFTSNTNIAEADSSKYDVAVMYLDNMTDNEKYGDQLVQLIHTNLAEDPSLKVVSRQWIYDAMKEISGESRNPDQTQATEVAKKIGVRNILVGSVVQQFEDVVVQVELVDVLTGEIRGTEKVEGKMTSIFELADNITGKITKPLQVESNFNVASITTNNYEAYQEYYKGEEAMWNWQIEKARKHFYKAIEIDSTFALARLGVVMYEMGFRPPHVYEDMGWVQQQLKSVEPFLDRLPVKERQYYEFIKAQSYGDFEESEEVIKRLISLDAEDRMTYNLIYSLAFDSDYAQKLYDSLTEDYIERHPSYGYEINHYAYMSLIAEDTSKALEYIERYVELEPQNYNPLHSAFEIDLSIGDLAGAQQKLDKMMSYYPRISTATWVTFWKGLGAFYTGDGETAFQDYTQRKDSVFYPEYLNMGLNSLALQGRFEEALAEIDYLSTRMAGFGIQDVNNFRDGLAGVTLISVGDLTSARRKFETIIARSTPDSIVNDPWYILSHYQLILVDIEEKKLPSAEKGIIQFKEHLATGFFDFRYKYLLPLAEAQLFLEQGELNKVTQKLTEVDRFHQVFTPTYHSILWRYHWKSGNYEKAINMLVPYYRHILKGRVAFEMELYTREYAFSDYNVGRIYQDAGNKEKALKHYNLFLERFKNSDPGIPQKEDAISRVKILTKGT